MRVLRSVAKRSKELMFHGGAAFCLIHGSALKLPFFITPQHSMHVLSNQGIKPQRLVQVHSKEIVRLKAGAVALSADKPRCRTSRCLNACDGKRTGSEKSSSAVVASEDSVAYSSSALASWKKSWFQKSSSALSSSSKSCTTIDHDIIADIPFALWWAFR